MGRRVGRRLLAAPGGEGSWLSGRGLELEENYNSTGECAVLILDSVHLPVGREDAEGLGFASTFFGHIGFLADTIGIVGEGGEDQGKKPLVTEAGEWGTRDGVERDGVERDGVERNGVERDGVERDRVEREGVERDESAAGERKKVSVCFSSFISRPSSGSPTARS